MVPRGTAIAIISIVTDPPVGSGILPADPFGTIRRSVVTDNEFQIPESLRQDGFDSLDDISLAVIYRHTHTHMRSVLIHHGVAFSLRSSLMHRLSLLYQHTVALQ